MRSCRLVLVMLFMVVVLAMPRFARADQPGAHTVPVAVLAFDSEDSEEQADAISGAIRSRIRAPQTQGWSLIETTQSLGMMTAAMKCPTRPPPECQQKIGEQLKAERYIFGFVSKGPTQNQVTVEVHLYQRGKPDTVVKESYADNLKDPNDDTLGKIAAHIVERLGGTSLGVVVVRSSELTGDVVVDGEKHVPLVKGVAKIELAAGGHAIELASGSGAPIKRNVLVTTGRETVVDLSSAPVTEPPNEASKTSTRKLIGGISMGAGAVLAGIAVYEVIHYLSLQSDGEERATHVDKTNPPKPCKDTDPECQRIDKSSKVASGLAIGLGATAAVALGFGAYMFFTAPSSSEKPTNAASTTPPKPKTRVVPTIGTGSGGVVVVGTF